MIGEPPSDKGTSQARSICVFPARPIGKRGALGTVLGVTGEEGTLSIELAFISFVAYTVNVYGKPFARPGTVVDSPDTVIDMPSGVETTV